MGAKRVCEHTHLKRPTMNDLALRFRFCLETVVEEQPKASPKRVHDRTTGIQKLRGGVPTTMNLLKSHRHHSCTDLVKCWL